VQSNRALATYLKDHFAGSSAGVSLASRIADGAGNEYERHEMEGIAADIEADRRSLRSLMERLEVSPSRVKSAGAWLGQKVGAVKLNAIRADNRVLQYESMIMGVTGKLELWRSLEQNNFKGAAALNAGEVRKLRERAENQRARLEKLHADAASALRG